MTTDHAFNKQSAAILLVAAMALSIARRGAALETGRIALDGAAELTDNPTVRRADLSEA